MKSPSYARVHARKAKRPPRPRLPLLTGDLVTIEQLPSPKELKLHFSVAKLLFDWCKPDWQWTHFPAGELRDEVTGAKLQRMGLKPGWGDFILVSPVGLFHTLELKRLGRDLTEEQEAFEAWSLRNGIPYAVADTFDKAMTALEQFGCLRVNFLRGNR